MASFNYNIDFIPVSADFIENHLPAANGTYVKVYLYSLMLGARRAEMTTAQLAEKLDLLESDVVKALKHWDKEGVLTFDGGSVLIGGAKSASAGSAPKTEPDTRKKDIREIAEEMTSNKALADLCEISQEILGRQLKKNDIQTLYWFYDELGLSPEVITMLLEYCVSKEKRNMSYIEKIAISWHKNGILTIEAADKFINSEKESETYLGMLKKHFGFNDRNLTKSEETYLLTWRDSFGMDENMVALAYEYCIDSIHSVSFPYMDTIIKRWHELGIHTVEAAEKDHADFIKNKSRAAGKVSGGKNDYEVFSGDDSDFDEIEKLIQSKM